MPEKNYVTDLIVMSEQGKQGHLHKSYMVRDPKTDERHILNYEQAYEMKPGQKIKIKTIKTSFFKKKHRLIEPFNFEIDII